MGISLRQKSLSVISLAFLLISLSQPNGRAIAQGISSRYFPETDHTVSGVFLDYWNAHGGLAQYGYPISDELQERSDTDTNIYTVQYFERAVFERHPENAGTQYEVQLTLLGNQQYLEQYGPGGASNQRASTNNPRFFPETKHTVGGVFRTYWENHGGLTQQGYPISDEFQEVSQLDGKPYTVQYFERAVFELHPENTGTQSEVLLSQLGTYRQQGKYGQLELPHSTYAGLVRVGTSASPEYVVWGEVPPPWFSGDHSSLTNIYAFGIHNSQFITVTTVPGGYPEDVNVSVNGSTVVWGTRRGSLDYSQQSIMGMNLPDGSPTLIYSTSNGIGDIMLNNRTVSWVEISAKEKKIKLTNLDTQLVETVAILPLLPSYTFDRTYLALSDEYLVWAGFTSIDDSLKPQYVIHAYNLETHSNRTIVAGTFVSSIPGDVCCLGVALSGHSLVWSDNALHHMDLLTGKSSVLYNGIALLPSIRGNSVVWAVYEHWRNEKGESGYRLAGPWGMKLSDGVARPLTVDQLRGPSIIAGDWLFSGIYHIGVTRLSDAFSSR